MSPVNIDNIKLPLICVYEESSSPQPPPKKKLIILFVFYFNYSNLAYIVIPEIQFVQIYVGKKNKTKHSHNFYCFKIIY